MVTGRKQLSQFKTTVFLCSGSGSVFGREQWPEDVQRGYNRRYSDRRTGDIPQTIQREVPFFYLSFKREYNYYGILSNLYRS